MNEKQYVEKVMAMIHGHREQLGLPAEMEDWEEEFFPKDIAQMFQKKWTLHDTFEYLRHMEHVNPNMNEDYACREMKKLREKYE